MNDQDQHFELTRLENIFREIDAQLASGTIDLRQSQAELNASLADYWENVSADFRDEAQFVENVARQRSLTAASNRHRLQLRKLADSPYFGRIDFLEDRLLGANSPERIYIGTTTLANRATGELLIYDWRSPVAGMFYDYERGKAGYHSPEGFIPGEISLKRQYKIIDRRMEYMFDSDLKIDDEILQEILGKNADAKMRAIVTTIQREQNKAIRANTNQILFVQGPAGSGKTSIALHRAAYLLYRERETITAKNILIFSPNRIFSDYIANVLPELGEENVPQTTFHDYIIQVQSELPVTIEDRDDQLEYLYQPSGDPNFNTRRAGISYKSSPDFTTVIRNYLTEIQERVRAYPPIEIGGVTILTRAEWEELFYKNLNYLPIAKRLAQIKRLIQDRLQPIIHQLRREEELKIAATGEEVNARTIKALARLSVKQRLDSFNDEIKRLTELNPLILYRQLFEDQQLFSKLVKETKIPPEWTAIRDNTSDWLDQGWISYEDSLPLLYLQGNLHGFPVKNNIRHLVIDEAQDYTILQYEILKRVFVNSSWTILGDPAQSIHPYLQTADFETAARIFEVDNRPDSQNSLIIQLNRSYRSTREIQSFCRQLLSKEISVEPINRSGPLPLVFKVQSPQVLPQRLIRKIKELVAENCKSIAIICKSFHEAKNAFNTLKELPGIDLITPQSIEFHPGIVVVPAYLAKGLEFDAVLIYNANAATYGNEADRNILYTACSRALHRLILFYQDEISPCIRGVAKHLYQIGEINHGL